MSSELKPCPFCSGEAETMFNTKYGYQAFCTNSDCFMSELIISNCDTEDKVIKLWNTRKPMDVIMEELNKEIDNSQGASLGEYRAGLYKAISIVEESNTKTISPERK